MVQVLMGAYHTCQSERGDRGAKMLLWLQIGFMPLNQKLAHAGFGGTFVGAIPPLPIIGIH
jgi:hypothetical protein